jgi:dimethylargininase
VATTEAVRFGGQSAVAPLRRALLVPPTAGGAAAWRAFGWRRAVDPADLAREHAGFVALLQDAGVDVVLGEAAPGDPDSVFAYDPCLVADAGAVVLRSGKPGRRGEHACAERALAAEGIPVVARLEAPATCDGGDTCWLDERTLLVARSYRTNDAGIAALRTALPDVEVVAVDLPHWRGPAECVHLMSFLSPVREDLAVAFPPLLPARAVEALADRGVRLLAVDEDELDRQGCNVLALAPGVVALVEGCPKIEALLRAEGVEVRTFPGDALCVAGDGGPTCLTRPLLRAA